MNKKLIKEFEKRLSFDKLESDSNWIIGIDEVGQGCFSGPMVVGAVAVNLDEFSNELTNQYPDILKVKDSKKLQPTARGIIDLELKKIAEQQKSIFFSIAESSVKEINDFGLTRAHDLATARALNQLKQAVYQLGINPVIIIDGNKIDTCLKNEKTKCVIKADDKSFAVGCASILAKEFRDNLMIELSKEFPKYKWNKNKGYGTEHHRKVIKEEGITIHHRIKFCRKLI